MKPLVKFAATVLTAGWIASGPLAAADPVTISSQTAAHYTTQPASAPPRWWQKIVIWLEALTEGVGSSRSSIPPKP